MKSRAPVEPVVAQPNSLIWDQSRTPHWDEAKLTAFYRSALDSGANACFRWSDQKSNQNNSCHGNMHYSQILNGTGWVSAFKYDKGSGSLALGFDEVGYEAGIWYIKNFMLNRKFSPWAALLPYLTIVYNSKRVPIAYIVDGDENLKAIDKHLLQNFNIASRVAFNYKGWVENMYALHKMGFKKTEAWFFAPVFQPGKSGNITTNTSPPTVTSFMNNNEALRWFERKPNSTMVSKEFKRFCSVSGTMSSDNDRHIWGMGNRSTPPEIMKYVRALPTASSITTFFGLTITTLDQKTLLEWLEGFRKLVDKALGVKPDTDVHPVEDEDSFDDDNDEDGEDF